MGREAVALKRLKADDRRELIVTSARRLFAKLGYDATRMEDIAEAAGCTTGPVYHFFGSKRDLYVAALKAGIREASASLEVARGTHADGLPLERLATSCDHLLDRLNIREAVMYTLEAPRVLGVEGYRQVFTRTLLPFIEADLRDAMMAGEVEPEPTEPLAVIIGGAILTSLNHLALTYPRGTPPEELERFRRAIRRTVERLRI